MGLEQDAPAIVYVPMSQMPDNLARLAIQLLPTNLVVEGNILHKQVLDGLMELYYHFYTILEIFSESDELQNP